MQLNHVGWARPHRNKMAPVRKTLQQYTVLRGRLTSRLSELREKDPRRKPRHSFILINASEEEEEMGTNEAMASQSALVTDILVEIIQTKLWFLNEVISSLESLVKEDPRQATPFELQLSRFEDWVETNQQLFELNARLYETQKSMFDIRKTQIERSTHGGSSQEQSSLVTQQSSCASNILQNISTVSTGQMTNYISERLHPRNNRMTFEATKIEEYVQECAQFQGGTLENPPVDSQGMFQYELCVHKDGWILIGRCVQPVKLGILKWVFLGVSFIK